jgi:hypothetical protein
MGDEIDVDVETYNMSLLNISNPIKRNNGYGSQLTYNGNKFIIQTPLCIVSTVDVKNDNFISLRFKLAQNFSHFQFFCSVHELNIRYLTRLYTNPNYNDILTSTDGSEESIREVYDQAVKKVNNTEMYMELKLKKSTLFYNNKKDEMSGLEIEPGDRVVCLIKTNGLVFDEKSANQAWICEECLLYKKGTEYQLQIK